MEKISIKDIDMGKARSISKGSISNVYRFGNKEIMKGFNPSVLRLYKNLGGSMEKKILEAKPLEKVSEILIPKFALYDEDNDFMGYISNYLEGYNLGEYYDSLGKDNRNSLLFHAKLFAKIEDVIKRANDEGYVFPDLANRGNFIFDDDGNFKLIDYDGMQVGDNKSFVISKFLCPQEQYNDNKYSKSRFFYTTELDKKSLIMMYMTFVFNVRLNHIGSKSILTNEEITLDYLFDYIGLTDVDLMHKIWKIFSPNESNEFISEDIRRIADMYDLESKPSLEKEDSKYKCLIKKR